MKRFLVFIVLSFCILDANSQIVAMQNHNGGSVFLHKGAQIGFHGDIVNDGVITSTDDEDDIGKVLFYNVDNTLSVSGQNKIILSNIEVDVIDGLNLETPLAAQNELIFKNGIIHTPRVLDELSTNLELVDYKAYKNESDANFVDGYVSSISNTGDFKFPIGQNNVLRPLSIINQQEFSIYKAAYYKENPQSPSTTFSERVFDINESDIVIKKVSSNEFWDLDGTDETSVILTWNPESNIGDLVDDIANLRIVGWNKEFNKWRDLGNGEVTGDLLNGEIASHPFNPEEYEALTFGADFSGETDVISYNVGFSPNNDGINELFFIEGIELRPDNTLEVFNRWGDLLYEKDSYDNSWDGTAEHNLAFNEEEGLPSGVYYYILRFHDDSTVIKGYIYLMR